MDRYKDLLELLNEIENNILFLKKEVTLATQEEEINSISRPKIKSSFEHLRSCLEYCAIEIAVKVLNIDLTRQKVYFPYGKSIQEFHRSINRNLNGLNGRFYDIIESIQPHKVKDNWLPKFCEFTNYNKHFALQEQIRHNKGVTKTIVKGPGLLIENSGEGKVTIDKIFIGNKLINPNGPLIIDNKRSVKDLKNDSSFLLKIERNFEGVIFKDKKTGTDLLSFLEKIYVEVQKFIAEIQKEFIAII